MISRALLRHAARREMREGARTVTEAASAAHDFSARWTGRNGRQQWLDPERISTHLTRTCPPAGRPAGRASAADVRHDLDCHGTTPRSRVAQPVSGSRNWRASGVLVAVTDAATHQGPRDPRDYRDQPLRLQRERGADRRCSRARASAMGNHEGSESVSLGWSRACNDLVKRVIDLYPLISPACASSAVAGREASRNR